MKNYFYLILILSCFLLIGTSCSSGCRNFQAEIGEIYLYTPSYSQPDPFEEDTLEIVDIRDGYVRFYSRKDDQYESWRMKSFCDLQLCSDCITEF